MQKTETIDSNKNSLIINTSLSIFKEILKDSSFNQFNIMLNDKQEKNPFFLNEIITKVINKQVFMDNISSFMTSYQAELNQSQLCEKLVTIKKIVSIAYTISDDKLKNLYSIVKNILSLSNGEEQFNIKKEKKIQKEENHQDNKIVKKNSNVDSDTSQSFKKSLFNDSYSTLQAQYNNKKILKNITYQNNSIGNMIINFNNSIKDNSLNLDHERTSFNEYGIFSVKPPGHELNLLNQKRSNADLNENSKRGSISSFNKFTFDPLTIEKDLNKDSI